MYNVHMKADKDFHNFANIAKKRETFKGRFKFTERKQTLCIIERLLRGKKFSTEYFFAALLFCFNEMSQRTSFNTSGLKILNHR